MENKKKGRKLPPKTITDTPNPTSEELMELLASSRLQTPSMMSLNDFNFNDDVLAFGQEIDESNQSLQMFDDLLAEPEVIDLNDKKLRAKVGKTRIITSFSP
jgi:hypothetical protein